jgi:lysophospholipase L1-like esterase
MRRSFLLISALAMALSFPALHACSAGDLPWKDGHRVVFIGDSITQAGVYIQDIEAYLFTRFPDRKFEVIGLGLSSETVSGMTEAGHPYPRPDVRERLTRVLDQSKPDLVVVCYGMNDGIYHPPSAERLAAYQHGIEEIVNRIRKAGAEVLLVTPPPFDPKPIAARLRPLGGQEYGYQHPFDGYDTVLGSYGDWLVSKRTDGWKVADVHAASNRFVASLRESDPNFTLASDGVHPGATGHWLIAQEILKAWDAPADVDSASIDAQGRKPATGTVTSSLDGKSLTITWTTRIPMPHDPDWDPRLAEREKVDERFNRQRLVVSGLDQPRYQLLEGSRKLGDFSREQLAEGVDLARFGELSTHQRATELWPLVAERQRILGSAWLESVGHGPPNFQPGLPLNEAKKRAEALEVRIRALARPIPITLKLVPTGPK